MTLDHYFNMLLPEMVLVAGASMCLFLGPVAVRDERRRAGFFALLTLAAALIFSQYLDRHAQAQTLVPTLLGGGLLSYVRLMTMAVGIVLVLVNWNQPDPAEQGEYFAMTLFSVAGVSLVAMADDLIVLLLALELVSVPTYVMVALSRRDIRAQEAASKYFFLGALAAAMTAYGFSFLYGVTGTTAIEIPGETGAIVDRVQRSPEVAQFLLIGLLLSFAGLSFKIAAVPMHAYVADVYQGAAAPLAGLLGFLPKIGGFVGLIKVLSLVSWSIPEAMWWVIWIVAAATMTMGNTLALMQSNVKRMLAYSSVAHSGYMLIGLLAGPQLGEGPLSDGLSAMLFYVVIYGLMNLGAFAVLTTLSEPEHEVEEHEQLAGLARRHPWAALALAVCMFSLMGLPPTAGFLGKMYLLSGAFSLADDHLHGTAMIVLAVIAAINSAIAAAYYLRVVGICYLRSPGAELPSGTRPGVQFGMALCAGAMIALFIWPRGLMVQSARASSDLPRPIPARTAIPAPMAIPASMGTPASMAIPAHMAIPAASPADTGAQ